MRDGIETAVLLAIPGVPAAIAAMLTWGPLRAWGLRLAPWAALPALAVALAGWPMGPERVHWLLLGTSLGLDELRRLFLFFTSALWLVCGVYARAYHREDPARARMFGFFCATLAGNLGLVVAADAITFYLGFLTMSLAAYGLIVHEGNEEARRAGRVYLVLVVLGEALILPALWLAAATSPSLELAAVSGAVASARGGDLVFWLLAAGLGIKAAAVPLHIWLPLAHPIAPTPSSAVLSGAMVKAGVLGWLVLLPVGEASRPDLGAAFIVVGFLGAFGGALVGVMQGRPKSVLAYSSVSQMGLLAIGMGVALTDRALAPAALVGITAYALHHAFAKGSLFLGVGVVQSAAGAAARRRALILLALPALALAGLPLTSGVVVKIALKHAAYGMEGFWHDVVEYGLPWAAVGTTALMARFMWLLAREPGHDDARPGLFAPWAVLLVGVVILSFVPLAAPREIIDESRGAAAVWAGVWPAAIGIALAALLARRPWRGPVIPEGDLLSPLLRAGSWLWSHRARRLTGARARLATRLQRRARRVQRRGTLALAAAEHGFAHWFAIAGGFMAAVLLAVALLAA